MDLCLRKFIPRVKIYSSDCRGETRAGETKWCTIENSLFFEPLGPRPSGFE
jgi:hypothetical protein